MINKKFNLLFDKIKTAQNILIAAHVHPDVDAISSLGAMIEILKSLDKKFLAFANYKEDLSMYYLPHEELICGSLPIDFNFSEFDLIIILDCGSLSRSGLENFIKNRQPNQFVVEIDHHPLVDNYADLEIRDANLSSTTELIFNFVKKQKIKINKNLANCLMSGILCDTGNFAYSSASDSSVKIVADLVAHGAQFPKMMRNFSQSRDINSLKIWGLALSNLKINKKYKALIDFDAVVIAAPDSAFDDFDKYIIDQFIMKGGKAIWIIDGVKSEMDSLSKSSSTMGLMNSVNLDDQLFKYGARVNSNLVQDLQCASIPINTAVAGATPRWEFFPWYYFPLIMPSGDNSITKNLNLHRIKTAIPSGWQFFICGDNGIVNHFPKQNHGLSFGRDLLFIQTYFARVCCESSQDYQISFFLFPGKKPSSVLLEIGSRPIKFHLGSGPARGGATSIQRPTRPVPGAHSAGNRCRP